MRTPSLRALYRPTRFDRPQPLSRGWLILCAAVVSWLALAAGVYLAMSVLTWAVRFFG